MISFTYGVTVDSRGSPMTEDFHIDNTFYQKLKISDSSGIFSIYVEPKVYCISSFLLEESLAKLQDKTKCNRIVFFNKYDSRLYVEDVSTYREEAIKILYMYAYNKIPYELAIKKVSAEQVIADAFKKYLNQRKHRCKEDHTKRRVK